MRSLSAYLDGRRLRAVSEPAPEKIFQRRLDLRHRYISLRLPQFLQRCIQVSIAALHAIIRARLVAFARTFSTARRYRSARI